MNRDQLIKEAECQLEGDDLDLYRYYVSTDGLLVRIIDGGCTYIIEVVNDDYGLGEGYYLYFTQDIETAIDVCRECGWSIVDD